MVLVLIFVDPKTEFNEFEPHLKSIKNRFQLSVGLNLENIENSFKWNQPYLSRASNLSRSFNSLNSAPEHFRESNWIETRKKKQEKNWVFVIFPNPYIFVTLFCNPFISQTYTS